MLTSTLDEIDFYFYDEASKAHGRRGPVLPRDVTGAILASTAQLQQFSSKEGEISRLDTPLAFRRAA